MRIQRMVILLLCLLLPGISRAVVSAEKKAVQFYESALESYLSGDYEQAILLDSQALEVKPDYKKAKALLDVLVKEKDRMTKSEIWLRGEDQAKVPIPIPRSSTRAQRVIINHELDKEKLQELENRIQTVALLMERDSMDKFHELSDGQVQNNTRLDNIAKTVEDAQEAQKKSDAEMAKGFGWNYFFSLLAILLASWALWNSRQTRKEQERQLALLNRINPLDGLGNVVNIHK